MCAVATTRFRIRRADVHPEAIVSRRLGFCNYLSILRLIDDAITANWTIHHRFESPVFPLARQGTGLSVALTCTRSNQLVIDRVKEYMMGFTKAYLLENIARRSDAFYVLS